jgi:NAD(P)-dependent dehydrogenase (short-subunit alcohol dehydrogenase family)
MRSKLAAFGTGEREATMDGIEGKVIAISGGAGDIGSAMGAELTKHGGDVTLIDRKTRDEAASCIERASANGPVAYIQADVIDRVAIDAALAGIDGLDIAIVNQAVGRGIGFLELTQEQWQEHVDVNLTGCFNVAQSAARLMAARGQGGRIIFTGTWVMDIPWPEISAYSATKAGVKMLARSMARELAVHNILVNVIAPGIVYAGLAKHQMETEPQYLRRIQHVIPLGRPQQAEEVAQATAFLCSTAASYMTGSVLLADGGCSLFQFDKGDE